MVIVYTFPNTATVIMTEQLLLGAGVPVKVRPIPTAIKAGCGLSLCITPEFKDKMDDAIAKNNVKVSQVYSNQDGTFTLLQDFGN